MKVVGGLVNRSEESDINRCINMQFILKELTIQWGYELQ